MKVKNESCGVTINYNINMTINNCTFESVNGFRVETGDCYLKNIVVKQTPGSGVSIEHSGISIS